MYCKNRFATGSTKLRKTHLDQIFVKSRILMIQNSGIQNLNAQPDHVQAIGILRIFVAQQQTQDRFESAFLENEHVFTIRLQNRNVFLVLGMQRQLREMKYKL